MTDWSAKASAAQAKVEAVVGRNATISRESVGYDHDTDTVADAGEGSSDVCSAILSPQTITDDSGREVQATVATITREVRSGDILTVSGARYTVMRTVAIAPAGIPLLWSAIVEG